MVVPLVPATGCVGVVTVELKNGVAPDPTTVALARIFAAQLAVFVAPAAPPDPLLEAPAEGVRTATTSTT
jgi:hypothetical protein